ncbi:helix-turn-helix domain-containing protein [Pseudorhodoferax sp.]|uniref:AraC family transcriptional regulator n=1 Tax=Pseudorhodoferax sp. TaxID=1993553 RepID=UPI0039E49DC9
MPHPSPTPLAFGSRQAVHHSDARRFAELIASLYPGLHSYEALLGDVDFYSRSATLSIPGLQLAASAQSPTRIEYTASQDCLLLIPLQGQGSMRSGGRRLDWGTGQYCLYMAPGDSVRWAVGGEREYVLLTLDPMALERAALAMRGPESRPQPALEMDHMRLLPAQIAGVPVAAIARHWGALVDLCALDADALHQLGLQDLIYRQLVLLFRPDWLSAPPTHPVGSSPAALPAGSVVHKRRAIDRVCDRLMQDLSQRATLTDMAIWGHMSIRALQYAFQSRFGMSPSDWLAEQRLAAARERLRKGEFGSIALLAQECGFSTASRFSAAYRARYGELPSATCRTGGAL